MDTPPTFESQVAAAVDQTIKDSGVTVAWLCEKTGIPRTTLTRRLGGHSPFTVAELAALASALRVPVESFTTMAASA